MHYLIGLDIGTSNAKAVAVSTDGALLSVERSSYPAIVPRPGYHELDAAQLFNATQEVLRKTIHQIGTKPLCIALSAAMHSCMAVNAKGKPLSNLLTWADSRSSEYASQLKQSTTGQHIYQRTGTPLHPMSPLCKIAWIRDNQPRLFTQADKFVSFKEYLLYRWFGEWVVDYSIASATGLFDHTELDWYGESLAFCGINAASLSQPISPLSVFKKWKNRSSEELGLTGNVPVVAGASDGCLANLGELAIEPGDTAITIGTSAALRISGNRAVCPPSMSLFNYLLSEGHFITGGASNNGGNILDWMCTKLLNKSPLAIMRLARKSSPGAGGLFFLPWLYGERAPVWDATASGVFMNIAAHHAQPHFCRAVLEGVLFNLNLIAKAVENSGGKLSTVYANGGFTRSPFWVQMLADIFGKKVLVRNTADSAAFGAAIMGMKSLGMLQNVGDARSFLPKPKAFEPSARSNEIYRSCFQRFEFLVQRITDGSTPATGYLSEYS